MAHEAPLVVVLVSTTGGEQPFCTHGHWSFASAEVCVAEAKRQGYTRGRVAYTSDGTTAWLWPDPSIEDAFETRDCDGTPPDDEPGGFAPFRRRRA